MLTEVEKSHLKAEETFRYEVRKSLEKKEEKKFGRMVLDFFNSAFGLWLLSTVVVGLIVSLYSNIKTKNEIAATNTETMRKLTTEISGRLQVFKISLSQLPVEQYYEYSYKQLAHMIDGTGIIDKGSASQDRPIFIFPEFQDRTLQSLLFEMERLTKNETQATVIREGRTTIGRIKNTLMTMEGRPNPDVDYTFSQRMQQRAQTSPTAKLSTQDSLDMVKYNQQMTIHNQQLTIYHKKIKIILDSLVNELSKNSFLKEQSSY